MVIQADLVFSHAGYDATSYFRSEVIKVRKTAENAAYNGFGMNFSGAAFCLAQPIGEFFFVQRATLLPNYICLFAWLRPLLHRLHLNLQRLRFQQVAFTYSDSLWAVLFKDVTPFERGHHSIVGIGIAISL